MEILNNFGFEPTFFIAQIINFLVLAFVFKKFLYKPILKTLHARQAKIAQSLKDAEEAKLALETAEDKKDEIIKKATIEAEKIIEETKKTAEELREDLTAKAKSESEKIMLDAQAAATEQLDRAQKQAEGLAIDVSKRILNRILSEIFTREEKQKIITRNVKILEKYE